MTCCHLQQRFRFYLHHCDSRLDQRYQLSESTETTDAAVACSINCWQLKNKWWEMHALCKLKLSTRTWSRYVNRRADQHTHTQTVFSAPLMLKGEGHFLDWPPRFPYQVLVKHFVYRRFRFMAVSSVTHLLLRQDMITFAYWFITPNRMAMGAYSPYGFLDSMLFATIVPPASWHLLAILGTN